MDFNMSWLYEEYMNWRKISMVGHCLFIFSMHVQQLCILLVEIGYGVGVRGLFGRNGVVTMHSLSQYGLV